MQDNESEFEEKIIKNKTFLLGIFLGLILSIMGEAIIELIIGTTKVVLMYFLIIISLVGIYLLYGWNKMINSIPQLIEYEILFNINEKFSWEKLYLLFESSIKKRINKEYPYLKIREGTIHWDKAFRRSDKTFNLFTNFSGTNKIRFYQKFKNKSQMVLFLEISKFGTTIKNEIETELKNLKELKLISNISKIKKNAHIYRTIFFPFTKKRELLKH